MLGWLKDFVVATCSKIEEDPCKSVFESDQKLLDGAEGRAKKLSSAPEPGATEPCKAQSPSIAEVVNRMRRYKDALPGASAAYDLNQLGDKADAKLNAECLERLPLTAEALNSELGLAPNTVTDADLRNDETGFRAALYRSKPDNRLILVSRDTQPNSLVDWQTNIDNGNGKDSDQYKAIRVLSGKLSQKLPMQSNGRKFDIAGYSKGGGLAQEAGLVSTNSNVYVFNSAGLHNNSLKRTGAKSFSSLEERTKSFSSEGDFLTFMNNSTENDIEVENAEFLRTHLAGETPWSLDPIKIKYRNPEMRDKQDEYFDEDKQAFLEEINVRIKEAKENPGGGKIFPPVYAGMRETIPDSMTSFGENTGARDNKARFGKLYQHQMSIVKDSMERSVKKDREMLKGFLKDCP